jgi:hypothetical protein
MIVQNKLRLAASPAQVTELKVAQKRLHCILLHISDTEKRATIVPAAGHGSAK